MLPALNNIVIMPVAINTDVPCVIGEEVQRSARCALVLVFVFPAGLRTDTFAQFNMAKSRPSTGQDVTLRPEYPTGLRQTRWLFARSDAPFTLKLETKNILMLSRLQPPA
jgi:hypothetical protein